MATRTITGTVSANSNADLTKGKVITFTTSTDTGTVSNATVSSATLYLSSFKTYVATGYFTLSFASGGATLAKTPAYAKNSTAHSETVTLTDCNAALLTTACSNLYLTTANTSTSSTANTVNVRNGCTFTLTINYTENYTKPTAPTSLSFSSSSPLPNASVTLSWSGASAGTNNAITGYSIYRSTTSSSSDFSWHKTVSTTATSGSVSITAPATFSTSYYYKIMTLGTQDSYKYSAFSTVITLTTQAKSGSASISVSKHLATSSSISIPISRTGNVSSVDLVYRDSSDGSNWGSWTALASGITASTYSATLPSAGYFRQFSVHPVWADSSVENGSGYPIVYRWSGSWTDTLTSGSTLIKATHMTEIQNLANKARIAYGLSTQSFTTITAGSTQLSGWSSHVGEIRTAANACASKTYTTISTNNCSAAIMNELRTNVAAL